MSNFPTLLVLNPTCLDVIEEHRAWMSQPLCDQPFILVATLFHTMAAQVMIGTAQCDNGRPECTMETALRELL